MLKQLPFPCEKVETNEKQISHSQRTPDSQTSSLFPQLPVLKLDPDLDGNPPIHPSAPPPYNTVTPSKRREADYLIDPGGRVGLKMGKACRRGMDSC